LDEFGNQELETEIVVENRTTNGDFDVVSDGGNLI